ncbi:MAG TPA: TlpA disulfide reductase family protein [Terriglobales bacterium]|jgi:thiol-disulfide isomerase/thioredoxin|nr:TlpA disulfide reductase family protein [Terriglobales bacterium]
MTLRSGTWRLATACMVVCAAPLLARAGIIDDVRVQVGQNSYAAAEGELRDYRTQHGVTPEYVEAYSWVARGAASMKQWSQASNYALQTQKLCEQLLAKQKLDAEPHLPIALGASYEVQAQALAETGKRTEATALLRAALVKYGNTSIRARLQKNLNLISFVGQLAPALQATEFLGNKPPTLASLKGSPVLLFFWAHWCVDCKGEVPIIARLKQEFSSSGLAVIGPTQLYGYAAQGNDATPAQEKTYIESVRQRYYASLPDMPVPLSKQNFNTYGASTTPTLVILNRAGQVAMYHPGAMPYEELRAEVEKASR